MKEFYKKNPLNSYKFVQMAKQSMDTEEMAKAAEKEAKQFLRKEVAHDQRKPVAKFIPIVSKTPGGSKWIRL